MSNPAITRFTGEYRFLSNFWPCPVSLMLITYPSAEHAYQAHKVTSLDVRRSLASADLPAAEAKRWGKRQDLRPGWERVKKTIMLQVVLAKFIQHPDLAKLLAGTEDATLIEGNTWHDDFWGSCLCSRCGEGDFSNGLNYLGQILMMARTIVRED
jgi:ribA/ribD-fused uncharacterized protein